MTPAQHIQRWLLTAAGAVYLAAIVVAIVSPAKPTVAAPPAAPEPASAEPLGQIAGFALGVHHVDRVGKYTEAIDEIAALGCNAVELITPIYQTHGASIALGRPPERCPNDAQLGQIIRHAKARGMTVHVMPIVLLTDPRDTEWRGRISPPDWDTWWSNYTTQIVGLAAVAEDAGAELFSVGSELLTTEKQNDRWLPLIAEVRRVFNGRLVYSTNWDHYHVPTFWSHLDLVGINGYWRIADDATVTPDDELARRWREIRGQVLAFAAKAGNPVLFTEIGYPSLDWGLKDPWNYVAGRDDKPNVRVQTRGYQGFLTAWHDDLKPGRPVEPGDRFAGVFFYEWDLWADAGADTGYGVKGKPVFELLRAFFRSGESGAQNPGEAGGQRKADAKTN